MRRAAIGGVALALAGCGGSGTKTSTTASTPPAQETTADTATGSTPAPAPAVHLAAGFHLTSPAFSQNGQIPRRYTCDGAGTAIPLRWSGVPRNAKELVLVMRDPDAPSGDFVHWAVAGISPGAGAPTGVDGRTSTGRTGYTPPCPPAGKAHHYVITLSALGGPSHLRTGFTPDQLRTAAVGIATLIGTYARR